MIIYTIVLLFVMYLFLWMLDQKNIIIMFYQLHAVSRTQQGTLV